MSPALDEEVLYKNLLELAVVERNTLDDLHQESKASKVPLSSLLLERNLISDENLGKLTADILHIPYVHLASTTIPYELARNIPEAVARREKVMLFERTPNGIKCAMITPTDSEMIQLLEKKLNQKLIPYFATEYDILQSLSIYKNDLSKNFQLLFARKDIASTKDATVSKIVDMLFSYAYQNRTSDIHIEPKEHSSLIRFRIDGVLHDILTVPRPLHDQIVARIKILSRLRTDEHLAAQDGKLRVSLEEEDLDVRVSIVPIITGEKVVMRILSSSIRKFSLSDLGMSKLDLEKLQNGFTKPYGMVLSTGPTGSGKTTTIYAILKIVNTREKNIATIEDPDEYEINGINQILVNPKTGLTFANGLRSILRQDPDIIFVGEIRDEETAGIAVNSALTGHLVLSTLHTSNAATTLPRLFDMGIEPYLVASTMNVIVAQRLIRKICEACRSSRSIPVQSLQKYFSIDQIKKYFGQKTQLTVYHGKGCAVCHNTGFAGRIGMFEVLEVSDTIRELIGQKATADNIQKEAIKEGMIPMMEDGLSKVALGITTIEEVVRGTKG